MTPNTPPSTSSTSRLSSGGSASKFLANEFPLKQSPILQRLKSFLPQISAANSELPVIPRSEETVPSFTDECGVVIEQTFTEEDEESESDTESEGPNTSGRYEECETKTMSEVDQLPFKVQLIGGLVIVISVHVIDNKGEKITNVERIRLKLNEDRVLVLLDNRQTLVDFHSPFRFTINDAKAEFDSTQSSLIIRAPVDWS
ncbi:hypothetical protein M3Y94_01288300 [Aphelenchoides besseyi]|nr:hypothetical protein M3Y94_01288300 [Aphelenchoides besseyi]KAI6222804.1 hypothetical protein M3Y95_00932500 [Aphelenchoides besseyi]